MGQRTDYQLSISGLSCTGDDACWGLFFRAQGSGQVSLSNSCVCDQSCAPPLSAYPPPSHCQYNGDAGYNMPLAGLPACSTAEISNVPGRNGYNGCGSASPSASPSILPSSRPSASPSSIPSNGPSNVPSSTPSAHPTTSRPPSESPSRVPSNGPSSAPSSTPSAFCPDDGNWVDCLNGKLRSDSSTSCASACGDDCCVGTDACYETTACIKKDKSCSGDEACRYTGYESNYQLKISGPSCVDEKACSIMFRQAYFGMGVVSVTNSCLCQNSCRAHCLNGNDYSSGSLPACGNDIIEVSGQSSSSCAVSLMQLCVPVFFSSLCLIITWIPNNPPPFSYPSR